MFLLVRIDRLQECVAWTGTEWSPDPCEALRLRSVDAWRDYYRDHAVDGDVVEAQMMLGDHMGRLPGGV